MNTVLRKVLLTFTVGGVMVVSAASNKYHVQFFEDVMVDGKSIKAGEYTIEMQNNTAVMRQGKQTIEVPAHTESVEKKADSTTYRSTGGKLEEMQIRGSRTKIVFGAPNTTADGTE